MEIQEILQRTGLTDKETRVYLALLELGSATVETIAKKAEIKRPTAYHIMNSLEEKGLVSQIPRAKKSLYAAESPERIVTNLNKKAELVKRYLPDLLATYNLNPDKPQVQMSSGKDGVRQIYQEIIDSGEASFFSSIARIAKLYPDLLEEFGKRIAQEKIKFRDLFQRTEQDLSFVKKIKDSINYEARFMPDGVELPSDSGIYDDKVVFFSFQPNLFVVVIKSKEVSKSLKAIYDLAWTQAEPYEKIVK